MHYRFKSRAASIVLFLALFAAGCSSTADEATNSSSVKVILPAEETSMVLAESEITEVETETGAKTYIKTEMSTETVAEIKQKAETEVFFEEETAAASEVENANAKTDGNETEISETSGNETEIFAEATQASQETKLTLQQESPPETESKKRRSNSETQIETVSASDTYRPADSYSALDFSEQKGFWITYLEYASILRNKSEKSFKKSIGEYFDNISDLGFNTVYVQVRAFGDAYYDSELFPSGEQFNGTIGTKKSFDALKIMTECAHERGLSIHAWVNPMRLMTSSQLEKIDDSYTIKKWYNSSEYNGKYIVKSGDRWYLNPAYEEVTDLIAAGITEIVGKYDVDGIQIDDYFYPTTDKSFDKAAFAESGKGLSLSEWRISNVNKMVKKLYKAVHKTNSSAVFGISPQGSVENNYSQLYADVKTWCAESGYCDYILPQVYFGFESSALPYSDVISEWNGMVGKSDVKLVIGLAAYKIGAEDSWAGNGKSEWLQNSDILSRQMETAEKLSNYGGVAIYRYDSLFNPESAVAAQVNKELKNIEK